jgi:glucose-fructose oxidoreductase
MGHIAQTAVLPAFGSARHSELVAIVSQDAKKRTQIGKKYRLQHAYSYQDYERALAEVDAVYIALPNHLHCEYSVRAARAGVHVLCEKPMAVSSSECEAMMQAAKESGVKLMVAYRLHFERGNLEAAALAAREKLGKVRFFSSEFAQQVAQDNVRLTMPVAKGGGPIYDMGIYCINAARYLFQAEPSDVVAVAANARDPRFHQAGEMVSAVLRFPEERIAAFTCSFGATHIGRYTLAGTKGELTANPAYSHASSTQFEITVGSRARKKTFPKRDQFAAELTYFSDRILKGREPEPSGLEGLADVRIVEAIYASIDQGKSVKIDSIPQKARPTKRQEMRFPAHGEPATVKVKSPSGKAS